MTNMFELKKMAQEIECRSSDEEIKEVVTIKGKPVIGIYESFDGSYWFITDKAHKQDSVIKGRVYKDDQILFGYVRLSACPGLAEFGYISETELKLLGNKVWKVPKRNWCVCPEVEVKTIVERQSSGSDGRGDIVPRSSNQQYSCTFQAGG